MARYDTIIKGGRLLDPAHGLDGPYDVAIAGGRVEAVEPDLNPAKADDVIDASGWWVMPGHIDTHVHVALFGRRGDRALGYRMMAEAGVTTAIDFAGTVPTLVEGVRRRGAGLNIGGLYMLAPGITVPDRDPSAHTLRDTLARALREGSLGFKCIGGHYPLTPEATARAIAVCNEARAYVALHCGSTATSSNLLGLRELPDLLGDGGRLHVAHVNAYCRGMVRPPLEECAEALDILTSLRGRVVSEVHLAVPNGTGGRCDGDQVVDHVTRNCLRMGGYPVNRQGLRRAIQEGYAGVIAERGGRVVILRGPEALQAWEEADTDAGVSFPVNLPQTAFILTAARHDDGSFVVDAVSTDGGYIPRNIAVQKTWAMVQLGALTPLEMAAKLSWNPARMFGLTTKGHLGPGADADVTAVDPATGRAVLGMVGGRVVMVHGRAVASGGSLLVTAEGEAAAREYGLPYQVVDLSRSALYSGA